jgi:hypothetical protein
MLNRITGRTRVALTISSTGRYGCELIFDCNEDASSIEAGIKK